MSARTCRSATIALLALATVGLAASRSQAPVEGRDAADSLHRAQIEQELILAESTAVMYGDFDAALADMKRAGGER